MKSRLEQDQRGESMDSWRRRKPRQLIAAAGFAPPCVTVITQDRKFDSDARTT
jgi:hypothetical protein